MIDTPFEAAGSGLRVRVRLTPRARRDTVTGVVTDENDKVWLAATVSVPPEDGAANHKMLVMLARRWQIARTSIKILSGHRSRRKVLFVRGDPATLLPTLSASLSRSTH